MTSLVSLLSLAVIVFASTNVDDLFVLAAWWSNPQFRPSAIIGGQFLGIGALVAVSTVAAVAAMSVPAGYTALLGVVPVALGVQQLCAMRRRGQTTATDANGIPPPANSSAASAVATVATVTIANGGDNLGVYIPLFASTPRAIPAYAAVFAAMTCLWCLASYLLVNNRILGEPARRYGRLTLPFVLIGLGFWILSGVRALLPAS